MSPSRARVISWTLSASIAVWIASAASAQIIELRDYHGKQISCARSGLQSFERPCGLDTWYEDIFVGSVLSVKEIEGSGKVLEITPEEIFRRRYSEPTQSHYATG